MKQSDFNQTCPNLANALVTLLTLLPLHYFAVVRSADHLFSIDKSALRFNWLESFALASGDIL